MTYALREMTIADYNAVHALWLQTEFLTLNECDSLEGIALYLRRNPGLCFVAELNGEIAGAVLCGHDGRRGMLRHLSIAKAHRGHGLSRQLVEKCLAGLAQEGIGKCNIFVDDVNVPGFEFWAHLGWAKLDDTFRTLQTPTRQGS